MWQCTRCDEECEDSFDNCWSCGVERDGSASAAILVSPESKDADPGFSASYTARRTKNGKSSILSRYTDAYTVARSVSTFGATVKLLSLGLGAGIAFLGFFTGSKWLVVSAIGLGATAGLAIYVLGTLVAAQGQILKATLDSAVNSSQFLSKEEMRQIMSLT
jgi:hypothetical protein